MLRPDMPAPSRTTDAHPTHETTRLHRRSPLARLGFSLRLDLRIITPEVSWRQLCAMSYEPSVARSDNAVNRVLSLTSPIAVPLSDGDFEHGGSVGKLIENSSTLT